MVGKAFDWKIDTFYSFFFDENKNKYVAYGRVRGTAENGGWDSDSYPDIDRRGISFHSNDTWGTDWSNPGQIIADPMDYWNYDSEMIPDFYTPNVYWDENEHKYLTLRSEDTRLNSSHVAISYAVFCLKKKTPISELHTN